MTRYGAGFPKIHCPKCGGDLVLSDVEEQGEPKIGCLKCNLYGDELLTHYHSSASTVIDDESK